MPYPNQHSARMISPEQMKEPYARKNIDKGVDIVLGTMKNGSGMKVQAYRFNSTKWTDQQIKEELAKITDPKQKEERKNYLIKDFTASEAKQWCKNNKINYILFTPAGTPDSNALIEEIEAMTIPAFKYFENK